MLTMTIHWDQLKLAAVLFGIMAVLIGAYAELLWYLLGGRQ